MVPCFSHCLALQASACLLITLLAAVAFGFASYTAWCLAAYMNQIKPTPVSKEVAARYPINIFLTYTKEGVRQHTLESFPPGCTPAMLATMMQTGIHTLAHVSPYGVRLLVSSPISSDALIAKCKSRDVLCACWSAALPTLVMIFDLQ